jgi:DNA-binding transcriptional MerR regulator
MESLRIGQVSRRSGVSVDTLRYYERIGLVPEPERSASGYRQYPPEVVERLHFIRRARGLGFSLRETGELLDLRVTRHAQAEVRRVAAARLAKIEAKLEELEAMRRVLEDITEACTGEGPTGDCPILAAVAAAPEHPIGEGETR